MKTAWPAIKTKAHNRRFLRCRGKRRTLARKTLAPAGASNIQGISPQAMPVWQMAYSAFGADLANGYEARPTTITISTNFKPDLWEWVGLPSMGGADDWSWYAGGGNGLSNGSVLTAPVLNIRYPGQYHDAESGLSQNWWRSYDARMGRYTQNDPISLGGGMNRFNYVDGDGVNKEDRQGLKDPIDFGWKAWKKWDAYKSCKEAYEKGKDAAERDERAACKRDKEAEQRRAAEDRTIETVRMQRLARGVADGFSGHLSDIVGAKTWYTVPPYYYGRSKYESQPCEVLLSE